jgi:hypothetical protein
MRTAEGGQASEDGIVYTIGVSKQIRYAVFAKVLEFFYTGISTIRDKLYSIPRFIIRFIS